MTQFGDRVYQLGGVPVGLDTLMPPEVRMVYSSTSAAPYAHWSGKLKHDKMHSTLLAAYNATTSARNDMILVTPSENHEISASLTWSNNDVHLRGMSINPMQPHVDFWMKQATTFDPMILVSGRGNTFANLTFRHGSETGASTNTGYATDLTCMRISGRYNYFENVYFYTPLYAEQDVASTYIGVDVTGHNNYFKGCKFGSDGLERDQANYNLQVTGVGNIFEDCIFQMYSAATSPFFVYVNSGTRDMKYCMFKNCTFYAHNSNYATAPADAIKTNYGANTVGVIFDADCNFVNVSNVSDTSNDNWIWKPVVGADETITAAQIALRNQGA